MAKNNKTPLVVGGINLSTKFRSKSFWVATIPLMATLIVSILSLCGVQGAEDIVNQYTAIATTIVSILAQLGVLVDHNTKGIQDSGIAQTYVEPRNSKDPQQSIDYVSTDNSPMPPNEQGELSESDILDSAEPMEYDNVESDSKSESEKSDNPKG